LIVNGYMKRLVSRKLDTRTMQTLSGVTFTKTLKRFKVIGSDRRFWIAALRTVSTVCELILVAKPTRTADVPEILAHLHKHVGERDLPNSLKAL
jgi:hypothetical protein